MDPLALLRAQMVGQSLRALARKMHVSSAYLSEVLLQKKTPGPKILRYLKLEKVPGPVTYRERPPRQKKPSNPAPVTEATPMS